MILEGWPPTHCWMQSTRNKCKDLAFLHLTRRPARNLLLSATQQSTQWARSSHWLQFRKSLTLGSLSPFIASTEWQVLAQSDEERLVASGTFKHFEKGSLSALLSFVENAEVIFWRVWDRGSDIRHSFRDSPAANAILQKNVDSYDPKPRHFRYNII